MATPEDQMATLLGEDSNAQVDVLDVGMETFAEEPEPVVFPQGPTMETSRGTMPSFGIAGAVDIERTLPGGFEAPMLDWSDKSPENNEAFYQRYFAPYRPSGMNDETYQKIDQQMRDELSRAVGFRMQGAPDTTVGPDGKPVFQFFGGYQGKMFDPDVPPEQRARILVKYGATDLVYAKRDEVTGQFVQPTFQPVAAVEELRQFRQAYESAEPFFTLGADLLSENVERRIPDLLLGSEEGAGKFVDFMERKGVTNPFILRDLAFMEATGHMDYLRKEAKALDPLRFLYNYTVAPALNAVNWIASDESNEVTRTDADGNQKVDPNQLLYGANQLAETTGLSTEQAESALIFNPDLVASTTTVAPEIAVDLGIAGTIRTFFARRAYKNWEGWLGNTKEFGGAKTLEDAVQASGKRPEAILQQYLDENVMKIPIRRLRDFMKAQRVESLDIYTGLRKLGGPKYRSKYMEGRVNSAVKEYDEARAKLAEIPAAQQPRAFKLAQDRLSRAENNLRRLDAESRYPEYFVGLAQEFTPAIVGAGTFAAIVQDSAQVTNADVLTFSEIGGAVAAAIYPNTITGVYTAPVLIGAAGVEALFNVVTGKSVIDASRVPSAAREWLSQLQRLEPEQYDQVVTLLERGDNITQRMLEIRDPNTGEQLFSPEDVQLTVAEMLNIPLLRIHQQAISDTATVGDIASFNKVSQNVNKRIADEVASLDRMAGALDRLSRFDDPNFAEQFPELHSFTVDMRSMHGALKEDLENRLNNLTSVLEAQEQDALLYLTGQKFDVNPDGSYFIPNYEEAFQNADDARLALMKIRGVDEDQILEEMQVVAGNRLQLMVDAAEEMRILTNVSPTEDPSVLMSSIVYGLKDLKERQIDVAYRNWENLAPEETFMDGRWIFDDLMRNGGKGLDDETLAGIGGEISPLAGATAGARRLYGANLKAPEINGLNQIFGSGAAREMKHYEELFEQTDGLSRETWQSLLTNAGSDAEDNPFSQWLKVHDYLAQADEEVVKSLRGVGSDIDAETLRKFAAQMSLPVSPVDMRLVASAFGRREFDAARGRFPQGAMEPGRTKRNFYAMAESEEYGFRSNYYKYNEDETRGVPVGEELIAELRDINGQFKDDIADRYRLNDTMRSWTLRSDGRKANKFGGSIQYKKFKGPAHWYENLAKDVNATETPAQSYEVLDEVLGMAFGGRKVVTPSGTQTYVLDAGDELSIQGLRSTLTSYLRQRLANSDAAGAFIANLDPNKMTAEQKEYATRVLMRDDPEALVRKLIDPNDKFFDAVQRVRVYEFDEAGNIIPGSGTPLINMDDVTEIFSFKNLEATNEKVAEIAEVGRERIKLGVQEAKTAVTEKFTFENAYQFSARDMAASFGEGAQGRERFYEAIIADDGLNAIDVLRQKQIQRVRDEAILEYGPDATDKIDEAVALAEEGFNAFVRRTVSRHINDRAIGRSAAGEVVRDEGAVRALEVDATSLDELIGDVNGTATQQRVAENLTAILGEEHYSNVKTMADFLARKNAVFEKLNITGEARGLSIESWLSRIYSISRGVVSPRYVLSEFAIQQVRMHNQSVFQKAIADPEIARHIAEMVRTGDIPTGEAADRFNEAILASIIRGIREASDEQEIEYEVRPPLTQVQ